MKTICKTNIRKALRKSWDTGHYVDVTEDWRACIFPTSKSWMGAPMTSHEVRLWNWSTEQEIAFSVGGCVSMTETIDYATECTLRRYQERFGSKAA